MHCNPDFPADILPVDVCMNAIIAAAWERGLAEDRKDVDFRNIVSFGLRLGSSGIKFRVLNFVADIGAR